MKFLKFSVVPLVLAMAACGGGNGGGNDNAAADPAPANNDAEFTVRLTNLTYRQPMSPPAFILHEPGYNAFIDGEEASVPLEVMAEGGSPADLLAEAQAEPEHLASIAGTAVPRRTIGEPSTLTVNNLDITDMRLTVTTMLINTNDAFTGLNAVDVSNMAVGESRTFNGPSWDAGTELNTETADTMPGPAAQALNGAAEGFNAARDDIVDVVTFHQGVVTSENSAPGSGTNSEDASSEGLATSILTEGDRWDNPTSRIVITRTR